MSVDGIGRGVEAVGSGDVASVPDPGAHGSESCINRHQSIPCRQPIAASEDDTFILFGRHLLLSGRHRASSGRLRRIAGGAHPDVRGDRDRRSRQSAVEQHRPHCRGEFRRTRLVAVTGLASVACRRVVMSVVAVMVVAATLAMQVSWYLRRDRRMRRRSSGWLGRARRSSTCRR